MNFNDSQKSAIQHGNGPMLVIAGPGSGKTTVLTARIKYLIENYKVNPAEILVITFTKAAAMEMQKRFEKLIGGRCGVTFGTFHAVFFYILKSAYNYSVNNIIKEENRNFIIRQAIEKSSLEIDDINETLGNIAGEISKVKTEGIDINVYYSANCPEEEFRKIYKYYDNTLKRQGLIDFDDMLLYCYDLFVKRPDILKKWQQKYSYILIDEFQDINKIQYDVIRMLALPQNNVFVVGDDDQSIYGFRGSKPEIMLNFENDYVGAKKVVMDVNYRSTANIVAAARYVIGNNKIRFDKNIRTVNPQGDRVNIVEFNTIREEYLRVVDSIRASVKAGSPHSEHAVLYRTNSAASPFIRCMIENNIPFVLRDGVPNIFEHWIAKDIFTYMDIALGSRKRADFIRIMNKPKRYIGRDYVTDSIISFDQLEKYYEDKPWMIERLDRLRGDLRLMAAMSPYAMINYLRKGVGYDEYLSEYADNHSIEFKELMDIAAELMESSRDCKTYADWQTYIETYTNNLRESYSSQKRSDDAVVLTTMHGSKGLEYDMVFIIDANEGITPHKKAVFDSEIEEERRMFYVAMTRARKQLNIFYAKERYNKQMEVSRFVREIM